MKASKVRCDWPGTDETYITYHDTEWGVPLHDDRKLFEFLVLEAAQAGLSWITVLRKREAYRKAFDNFDPKVVAKYDDQRVEELVSNSGIIRNRLKITASIHNAKVFLQVQKEFGSFDSYIWQFVKNKAIKNSIKQLKDYPAKTDIAEQMSKDLIKRGFKFVGPTICYAFMQATGMVNDHQTKCFRYNQV